ncbi:MAG TPA: tetratricopeptide repeat protein [Bryobacteraceae bacterium]|jgi:tetratricopeptide (TPR) repeat protein|nr:tetratricopeptide repeat protein [Bryobacteraceae bacterium]
MPQQRLATGTSFIGTFVLMSIALAALFVIDTFLARIERAEDRAGAMRLLAEGHRLMQDGHYAEAAERFKDAVAVERDNRDYRLALAEALLAAKSFPEAESTLNELLQRDSTDGDANLMMARVMVGEMRIPEGVSFYHRAIYGRWNTNAAQNRLRVRYELIDLLARQNDKEELLAELLPLQEEAPDDVKTRKRIGQLFLSAGSSARAADVFQGILRRDPQDPDVYAGLGEAEFARGNYPAARSNFLEASRLKPGDKAVEDNIRKRLELSEQIMTLDPTRRGLPANERYRRSLKLVALALDEINRCLPTPALPSAQDVLDAASKALKARLVESRQNAVTDANLDLAEQLWQIRSKHCGSAVPASGDALPLVLAKIDQ